LKFRLVYILRQNEVTFYMSPGKSHLNNITIHVYVNIGYRVILRLIDYLQYIKVVITHMPDIVK